MKPKLVLTALLASGLLAALLFAVNGRLPVSHADGGPQVIAAIQLAPNGHAPAGVAVNPTTNRDLHGQSR